jgi:hypothetical protein
VTTTPRTERAQELAGLVRRAGGGLEEAVKWGRLTFTAGGDWHHWVCAVAESAKVVALVFHKGVLLDDPAGLLTGDAKYIRSVPYDRAVADPDAVIALVRSAIAHQTDMLPG